MRLLPRSFHIELPADPSRRRLLGGLAGATVAAATGVAVWRRQRAASESALLDLQMLGRQEQRLWLALLPVILGSRLPERDPERTQSLHRTLSQLDRLLNHLPPWRRRELSRWSATLASPITRVLLAGSWRSWEHASSGEIRSFLFRWQHSPLKQLNLAYRTLVESAHLAWYADADRQLQTGYPGPPERILRQLPPGRARRQPA